MTTLCNPVSQNSDPTLPSETVITESQLNHILTELEAAQKNFYTKDKKTLAQQYQDYFSEASTLLEHKQLNISLLNKLMMMGICYKTPAEQRGHPRTFSQHQLNQWGNDCQAIISQWAPMDWLHCLQQIMDRADTQLVINLCSQAYVMVGGSFFACFKSVSREHKFPFKNIRQE